MPISSPLITDHRMEDRVQLILIVTGIGGDKAAQVDLPQAAASISSLFIRCSLNQHIQLKTLRKLKRRSWNNYTPRVDNANNLDVPAFMQHR